MRRLTGRTNAGWVLSEAFSANTRAVDEACQRMSISGAFKKIDFYDKEIERLIKERREYIDSELQQLKEEGCTAAEIFTIKHLLKTLKLI